MEVQGAAAHHDRQRASRPDLVDRALGVKLETHEVVHLDRIGDIDEMVLDGHAIWKPVLGQILACPDVQPPVDLPGVGAYYLTVKPERELDTKGCFTGGGRPDDRHDFTSWLVMLLSHG